MSRKPTGYPYIGDTRSNEEVNGLIQTQAIERALKSLEAFHTPTPETRRAIKALRNILGR
jgi:hypothetical protein